MVAEWKSIDNKKIGGTVGNSTIMDKRTNLGSDIATDQPFPLFSVHFTGYFKNEKKEKERKESERGRISQQLTSTPQVVVAFEKKISRALKRAEIKDSKVQHKNLCAHVKIQSF